MNKIVLLDARLFIILKFDIFSSYLVSLISFKLFYNVSMNEIILRNINE